MGLTKKCDTNSKYMIYGIRKRRIAYAFPGNNYRFSTDFVA